MTDKIPASDSEGRIDTRFVDHLDDEDLEMLNDLLPWRCFTLDSRGRRFGKAASDKKRSTPQIIPDRRIVELDRRLPLAGLDVLEIGCFEGIHTIALGQRGARVTAIDSRIENVVKTIVRTWTFGLHVTAFKCDVERDDDFALVPEVDVCHHVGVLYHLKDPVAHLQRILPRTRKMVMLDTHVAGDDDATRTYEVGGRSYAYRHFTEGGRKDAFSGMYDHAKWLPVEVLTGLLREQGFADVDVAEVHVEVFRAD
jgi:tRNA (mo5U34)-methyltransferase